MGRLILTNANLLDGDAPARRGATVIVSGERIEAITSGAQYVARADDRVVDLDGRTVMPGMVTSHYHAAYYKLGGPVRTPLGMEAPPGLQILRAAKNLERTLSGGWTSAVGAGTAYAHDGSLKAAIEEGLIPGPRLVPCSRDVSTTGHSLDHLYPWYWPEGAPGYVACNGADEFRKAVRDEIKKGAEFIKVFLTPGHMVPGNRHHIELTEEELVAVVHTAHSRSVRVRAHVANRDAILMCIRNGVDVIDHGDGFDEACIDAALKAGTFLVPSMLYAQVRYDRASSETQARFGAEIEDMMKILPVANKAGVKILLGDDYGTLDLPQGNEGLEPEFYARRAGIAPLDIIRWATRHGAELMGRGNDLGTLATGKLADLLVVDGDPLADLAIFQDRGKLLAIMKGGVMMKDELGRIPAAHGEVREAKRA